MTTFDRLDWHLDAAVERGRPPEHAFTHIGLFLAWLVRHDLHDPAAFPAGAAALLGAVRAGAAPGSALRDAVGDALTSDVLSVDGQAFTASYYPTYLDDYAVAFADMPDYGVVENEAAYRRIAPTLDRRFTEWQTSPAPTGAPMTFSGDAVVAMSDAELDEVAQELAEAIAGSNEAADEFGDATGDEASHDTDGNGNPHDAPDLEALVPRAIADVALQVTSTRVSEWQSSLLRQAVERLGVDPMDAFVALGLGGSGEDTVAVTLYAIPGVAQDRLEAEFSRPEYLGDGMAWERRVVDGKSVWWARTDDFDTAFYALGGLVVTVGASPERVRAALDVLP